MKKSASFCVCLVALILSIDADVAFFARFAFNSAIFLLLSTLWLMPHDQWFLDWFYACTMACSNLNICKNTKKIYLKCVKSTLYTISKHKNGISVQNTKQWKVFQPTRQWVFQLNKMSAFLWVNNKKKSWCNITVISDFFTWRQMRQLPQGASARRARVTTFLMKKYE